jgi:hypothetical protein
MGNEKLKRQERLFQKNIYLPKERKAEFEAMAKKEGLKLATWIQNHVGDLQELETYVKDLKEQEEMKRMELDLSQQSTKIHKTGQIYAFSKVLAFIEALKTKA